MLARGEGCTGREGNREVHLGPTSRAGVSQAAEAGKDGRWQEQPGHLIDPVRSGTVNLFSSLYPQHLAQCQAHWKPSIVIDGMSNEEPKKKIIERERETDRR